MARIFLYIVAGVIALAVAAVAGVAIFWGDLERFALSRMTLDMAYEEAPLPPPPDYADPASWAALPTDEGLANANPSGLEDIDGEAVDIFYVHPTTYLQTDYWNAPINHAAANRFLTRMIAAQASPFNPTGRIYAPRYRQAAFGAFLASNADTAKALRTAYSDVLRAFDRYVSEDNRGRPFILVGHSQGALHGLFLLRDRIAGTLLADRMVAAYLPGWPISVEADLDALPGIGLCDTPEETGCVATWQTFGAGGDASAILEAFASQPGLTGAPKAGTTVACVNPMSWQTGDRVATVAQHDGAVDVSDAGLKLPRPERRLFVSHCSPDGILYLSPPPGEPFARFTLPGRNYHVYDIHLFYIDIRFNALERTEAFLSRAL